MRKTINVNLKIVTLLLIVLTASVSFAQIKTSVLVVRGGHPYDTPQFEKMCKNLKGITADLVLTAHLESMKTTTIIEKYDAILFLNQNKHYPEYEGNKKKIHRPDKERSWHGFSSFYAFVAARVGRVS